MQPIGRRRGSSLTSYWPEQNQRASVPCLDVREVLCSSATGLPATPPGLLLLLPPPLSRFFREDHNGSSTTQPSDKHGPVCTRSDQKFFGKQQLPGLRGFLPSPESSFLPRSKRHSLKSEDQGLFRGPCCDRAVEVLLHALAGSSVGWWCCRRLLPLSGKAPTSPGRPLTFR